MTKLYIQFNDISSLDLSQNTQLTHLFCRTNQLTALNTGTLVNLQQLDCKSNQITSLDLTNNNVLNLLDFRSNQLTIINTSNLTNLSSYVCAQNQLTSVDISSNTSLITFDCSYMDIPTLDVSNNTQLQYLDCWNGILSSIDVSSNPALIRFRCPYNQITSINISNNLNINEFACSNNLLTSINLSNNTVLTDLRVDNNDISSLDVSSNNLLEKLYLSNTLISVIDISNLTQLEYLGCKNNTLSSLDLTNNINLLDVDIQNNYLSKLDVSGLTSLVTLRANSNSIDSIDVSNNSSLNIFSIGNNDLRYLDMRNGNNINMVNPSLGSNGYLYCVSVDDSTYSEDNWRTSTSAVHNNTVFNGDCEASCFIPLRAFDTINACSEYVINGSTVTNSGNYNDTLISISSCKDSIVRLSLTITNPNTSTDLQTVCDSFTWIDGNIYTENNNSATFTLASSSGCDSIITLDLIINTPDVSVNQSSETLTANTSGAQYQWIDCSDNSIINGAVMSSYTALVNGDYAVEITENGCVDTSNCYTINTTELYNDDENKGLLIYPNPVVDLLYLEFNSIDNRVITVCNSFGAVQDEFRRSQSNLKIDMKNYARGIYHISIKENETVKNFKVIR